MYLLGVKRCKYVLLGVLLQGQAVVPKKVTFVTLIFLCTHDQYVSLNNNTIAITHDYTDFIQ